MYASSAGNTFILNTSAGSFADAAAACAATGGGLATFRELSEQQEVRRPARRCWRRLQRWARVQANLAG